MIPVYTQHHVAPMMHGRGAGRGQNGQVNRCFVSVSGQAHGRSRTTPVSLALLLTALLPATVCAQFVTGRVTSESTGEPLPGVFIAVFFDDGEPTRSVAFTSADGRYSIRLSSPGTYRIRAELLGYRRAESDPVRVGDGQVVRLDLGMSDEPVRLDTLEARAAAMSQTEQLSMAGVRRRHAESPAVGPARVMMQGDGAFRNAVVVGDVLRWMPPGRGCMVWFVNGFRTDWAMTDMSADMFEAVEVYQRYDLVPAVFKTAEIGCGVVAVWSREQGAAGGKKLTWGRVALAGAIVGILFFLTQR